MTEFKEIIQVIEEYIKDKNNPILLIEAGNLTDAIYAAICLKNLKQNGYHTILLIDQKISPLFENQPFIDKLFPFKIDYKFRYKYREYMLKKEYRWLMPNPKLALQYPELMLQTHIILDQYMINSGFEEYNKSLSFNIKPYPIIDKLISDFKIGLIIGNVEGVQDIIYATRSKHIGVCNLSGLSYQSCQDGTKFDISQQLYLISKCKAAIGRGDGISLLASICGLRVIEICVDKYSSVGNILGYDKYISVSNNNDAVSALFNLFN